MLTTGVLGAPVVKTATTAGALGVLAVKLERSGAKYKRAHFLYGHTTDSMVSEPVSRKPALYLRTCGGRHLHRWFHGRMNQT